MLNHCIWPCHCLHLNLQYVWGAPLCYKTWHLLDPCLGCEHRAAVHVERSAAESVGNTGEPVGRSVGTPKRRSWCPLEPSSCVNEHQSKTANSQAKSHTCNQGNVLSLVEVSVFNFRLYHSQFFFLFSLFFFLPCACVMCCRQPPLQPAGRETQLRPAWSSKFCFIPWTSANFKETRSKSWMKYKHQFTLEKDSMIWLKYTFMI